MRKRKTSKAENKHQRIVNDLESRLEDSGRYFSIEKNLNYSRRVKGVHYQGEFDVITQVNGRRGGYHHYYEVKTNYTPTSERKAIQQFTRAKVAFPKRNWKFVLVTQQLIKQYKL